LADTTKSEENVENENEGVLYEVVPYTGRQTEHLNENDKLNII
jgi:hypothetical protein